MLERARTSRGNRSALVAGEWLAVRRSVHGSSRPTSPTACVRALAEVERLTRDAGCTPSASSPTRPAARSAWRLAPRTGRLPLGLVCDCSSRRTCARSARPARRRATTSSDRCALRSTGRSSRRRFDAIKAHLADGDTYQVNFTFKMEGAFEGDRAPSSPTSSRPSAAATRRSSTSATGRSARRPRSCSSSSMACESGRGR